MKNEEKLLFAIGNADECLIDEAISFRRDRKPTVLRWVAVAACVCLMLASPVRAVMTEALQKLIHENAILEYFTSDRLPIHRLSSEALAAFPEEIGQTGYLCMDTIGEAEEFLGIDLPDNPVLENALWDELHLGLESGERYDSHCILKLYTGDQPEPYGLEAEVAYRVNGLLVDVMYSCTTENNPYDNGGGVGFDAETYQKTQYIAENGRAWDFYIKTYDEGRKTAFAFSNINGMLTCVQIWLVPENIQEDVIQAQMIEIVEAYQ
jgi:hypothetical protein